MNCIKVLLVCCALLLVRETGAAEPSPKDRTVIMISLDGFPWWVWQDQALAVPTLRKLAAEGVASRMKVSNPSITWINHTTLVTGVNPAKHGVLYNGLLVRQGPTSPPKIEQWASKQRLVHAPTIYDLAFQAGLTTAQVDWVAITNAGTINWDFFEVPDTNGEISKELVQAGVLTGAQLAGFGKANITWRDMVWTKATAHILRTRKPNLMLFHPLTTDAANHRYGPGTLASLTAYAYADRMVAEVLEAVEASGRKDNTTVFIVTDHGFKNVSKIILPNVALRQEGLIRAAGPTVGSCDAYVMTQGGMAFVYVTDKAKRSELTPRLKDLLGKVEGVERVVEPKEYGELGMPTPEQNDGVGDLVLYPKQGYAFQGAVVGEAVVKDSTEYLGTHGYPNYDPQLDGLFIAWGSGIKGGAKLDRMANVDVAPTIAELLRLKLPNPDGKALQEILKR